MVANVTEKTGPAIDRSIYAMPMFINLVVTDLAAAEALYLKAGFVTLATILGPGGIPALVHMRREKYQDVLMTQGAPARGTASASFAAGNVDLAAVAEDLRSAGAEVAGPTDTLWFTTDVSFSDADGNTLTLTAPRVADHAQAQAWASDHISGDFEIPDGFSFDSTPR